MNRFFTIFALCFWGQFTAAEATLADQFVWRSDAKDFGGFSGLHLDANGVDFIAISDRGKSIAGQIIRENGQIVSIQSGELKRFQNLDGRRVWGTDADSEGLAIAEDGTVYVSFEGTARVWAFDHVTAKPNHIFNHPDFRTMESNASLEALAVTRDGTLFALPERSGRANRPFPVYRHQNDAWDIPFSIPRRNAHLIVGADIGPDDMLYILERDFTGIGFRTRVRRFHQDGTGEEILIDTSNASHDNLEGISVWRDTEGLRITMISDDNFRFLQQTEIVEYRLSD